MLVFILITVITAVTVSLLPKNKVPKKDINNWDGFGLRFIAISEQRVSDSNMLFKIINNDDLQGYVTLNNYHQNRQTFLLTVFLDYQQIDIGLNNIRKKIHRFTLEPQESMSFQFKLAIPEGMHDLFVALIRDPDENSSQLFMPQEKIIFRRAVVQKGKSRKHSEISISNADYLTGVNIGGVSFINRTDNSVITNWPIGDSLLLNISVPTQKVKSYILIALLNGEQIQFSNHGNNYVASLHQLATDGPIKMPIFLNTFKTGQLIFVLVPNPYTFRENEQGIISKDVFWAITATPKVQIYE